MFTREHANSAAAGMLTHEHGTQYATESYGGRKLRYDFMLIRNSTLVLIF